MSNSSEGLSSVNLIVRMIPYSWRERHLRKQFSPYGTITNYRVMRYSMLGEVRSKGYGFVRFSTHEEALAAIAGLNGQNFLGNKIRVEFARNDGRREAATSPANCNPPEQQRPWDDYCNFYHRVNPVLEEEFQGYILNEYGSELSDKWMHDQIYDWGGRCIDEGNYSDRRPDHAQMIQYRQPLPTVVVTNLPNHMLESTIMSMCRSVAPVHSITSVCDNNGRQLGIAYLTCRTEEAAQALVSTFHGCELSRERRLGCYFAN